MNTLALDQVHDVRTALFHFVHALHSHACGLNHIPRTRRSYQRETHIHKLTGNFRSVAFVMVGHADKDGALSRQLLAGSQLRLAERLAEAVAHAHHFASGLHLWPQHRIDARKLIPGKHWRLHVVTASGIEIGAAFDIFRQKFAQLAPRHQPCRNLRHRHAGRL